MSPFIDMIVELLTAFLRQDRTSSLGESRMDKQAKRIAWVILLLLALIALALWLRF